MAEAEAPKPLTIFVRLPGSGLREVRVRLARDATVAEAREELKRRAAAAGYPIEGEFDLVHGRELLLDEDAVADVLRNEALVEVVPVELLRR